MASKIEENNYVCAEDVAWLRANGNRITPQRMQVLMVLKRRNTTSLPKKFTPRLSRSSVTHHHHLICQKCSQDIKIAGDMFVDSITPLFRDFVPPALSRRKKQSIRCSTSLRLRDYVCVDANRQALLRRGVLEHWHVDRPIFRG